MLPDARCGNATPTICMHQRISELNMACSAQQLVLFNRACAANKSRHAAALTGAECIMQRMLPDCLFGLLEEASLRQRHAEEGRADFDVTHKTAALHCAIHRWQKSLSHVFMECLQCLPSGVPKCTTPQCGRHSVSCSETATVLVQHL